MKTMIFLGCTAMLFNICLGQPQPAVTKQEQAAIQQVIKQQEIAWNKHDWKRFSNHFTDEGTLINGVGQLWKGKNEIFRNLTQLSDCCLSATSLTFEVKRVRFITADIAVVYIEETLLTDKDYSIPFHQYKKGDKEYKVLTDVFVKTNNDWKLTAMQVTMINQLISPHRTSEKH
ncbi:hypothetical protein GCM10028805_58110 [Spirosoma harenae]